MRLSIRTQVVKREILLHFHPLR